MNVLVIAVFDTEAAALEGLKALRYLHREGGISLYASALIVSGKQGKRSIKKAVDKGPVGTALGLLTGSLIGILGGPAGVMMGAYLGGLSGSIVDLNKAGIDATFCDDAANMLTPGKAAIVAEVEESWTTLLDSRLQECGGTVFRRFRVDVVDDRLNREVAAVKANLKALEEELKQASADNKAAIRKDINAGKKQLKATQDQAKAKLGQAKAEMEARIKVLQDQAKGASDRAKARIEKRIAEVKANFAVRSKKLNQAWKLTKEALAA